jgi:site-specific DNA-cytosine methylase
VKGDVSVGTGPYAVSDPRHRRRAAQQRVPHRAMGRGLAGVDGGRTSNRRRTRTSRILERRAGHEQQVLKLTRHSTGRTQPAPSSAASQLQAKARSAVADPRPANCPPLVSDGRNYQTSGNYGVVPWDRHAGVVSANGQHDNGPGSVADPRLPAPSERLVCVIRALDGTWHRPFTTFDLAALQSIVDPEEKLELDGLSDSAWRERIGNAVPPDASEAIGSVIGQTLLLAWTGETFVLGSTPIWVRDVAVALTVAQRVPS